VNVVSGIIQRKWKLLGFGALPPGHPALKISGQPKRSSDPAAHSEISRCSGKVVSMADGRVMQ
jgi:hypothetical protein